MARYRYRRGGRAASRAATAFLLIVLAGVAVWFAAVGNVGSFITDRIIRPLTAPQATGTVSFPPSSASPSPVSSSPLATGSDDVSRITQTVYMEGFPVYCVQWGAFSNQENAGQAAAGCVSRGAAAYVLHSGGLYRVLGEGVLLRSEALEARDKGISQYGMDACLYELPVPAVSLKVVAAQPQIDAMQSAFDVWKRTVESMASLIGGFTRRELTADTCALRLEEYARDLSVARDGLSAVAGDTSDSPILAGLLTVLAGGGESLSEAALSKGSCSEAEFLTKMKYVFFDLLDDFCKYTAAAVP